MQQITGVGEGNWFDSWPGTMPDERDYQMDIVEAYEMVNGMCEDEEVIELNL